jgi:hypothetical protein
MNDILITYEYDKNKNMNYNKIKKFIKEFSYCKRGNYNNQIWDLYVENYAAPLDVVNMGLCPSTTPTPTVTPTPTQTSVTPTPTQTSVTPTQTPTPTVTPVIVYMANLRTGGYYQDVCGSTYFGNPANVTIYSEKPFSQLEIGDHVYGNSQLTIPPINANFTISNGSTFIQIGGTLIINKGICG